jgi:hypothetical protein
MNGGSTGFDDQRARQGLYLALQFEYLWTFNKQHYYGVLAEEDRVRIDNFGRVLRMD